MSGDTELLRCISAALEMRDLGIDPPLDELCADRPEWLPHIAQALADSDALASQALPGPSLEETVVAGRYRLRGTIGAGAMGVVHRATDGELQRDVALKTVHPFAFDTERSRRRFRREAEALAAIAHPAVVTIFDLGQAEDGGAFVVMELVDGVPLDRLLEAACEQDPGQGDGSAGMLGTEWMRAFIEPDAALEGSWIRAVVRWVAELADGLGTVHGAGVLHRDLKPSNVVLRRDGRPCLLDFGIAARTDGRGGPTEDDVAGTPAYMAPEVIAGGGRPTERADVYSLAATLYHLVTLRAPFVGTPSQVLVARAMRDPVPAGRLVPGLPRDLVAILDRGLEADPRRRYPAAHDLAADLCAFLDHRPVTARPLGPLVRFVRRTRRSRVLRTLASAAGIMALVAGVGSWRATMADRRAESALEAKSVLPPALTLWNSGERAFGPALRAEYGDVLDRMVESGVSAVPARAYRAAFHQDQGELAAARRDAEALAAEVGTPFARAVAASYAEARVGEPLPRAAWPDPETAQDHLLAAYHLLRDIRGREDVDRVLEWLEHPGLIDSIPAEELRLLLGIGRLPHGLLRSQERREAAWGLYERAVRLEEQIGRPTALTCHLIGATLVSAERCGDALNPLRAGIDLAPRYHGLLGNAGIALHRTGHHVEAEAVLESAIEARPGALKPYDTLLYVHLAQLDFEEARAVIARAPLGDSALGVARRVEWGAEVDYHESVALVAVDTAEARRLAARALEALDTLPEEARALQESDRRICRAIVGGDLSDAVAPVLELLARDPSNGRRLRLLRRLLPDDPTPEQGRALGAYLDALANHLAP